MRQINKTKRRILSAGVGVTAITALAGLACGNPVEPCGPRSTCIDAPMADAPADAPVDAPVDAGVDAPIDASAVVPQP